MAWFVLMGVAGAVLGHMSASVGVLEGGVFGVFLGAVIKWLVGQLRANGGRTAGGAGDGALDIDFGGGDSDCGDTGGGDGGGD